MDTITVDIDGHLASWRGGEFTGDPGIVAAATEAICQERTIDIFDRFPVLAESGHPVGALAALSTFNPGRVFITELPDGLAQWLTAAFGAAACGSAAALGE
ncbi:hypothetical protein [Pseudactinotalea sp. Z1748]|uniref:hypothetical protein n=1 Tax=Pseudactinotalea sp. Z1748 TaxID=3413027 RepID=UPI003C7BE70F